MLTEQELTDQIEATIKAMRRTAAAISPEATHLSIELSRCAEYLSHYRIYHRARTLQLK